MKRILPWALGIFLTVVGISKNPMLLIFPMWIFTYLNREPLRRTVSEEKIRTTRRLNLLVKFLIAAVALFVEWAVYGLFVLPALKRAFQAT
jgi:hypothetical protein